MKQTMKRLMKCMSAALLVSLLAAPAFAFSGVTSAFDGDYLAAVRSNSGGCPAFDIGHVTIKNGALKSAPGEPAISGFITEEGYVQATLNRNGTTGALDGRLEDGMISAGYRDGDCAWIVEMRPAV